MSHLINLILIAFLLVVFGVILYIHIHLHDFVSTNEDIPTGDDVFPTQTTDGYNSCVPQSCTDACERNAAVDDMVRLSEEMDLYDLDAHEWWEEEDLWEEKDSDQQILEAYYDAYPFMVVTNENGEAVRFFVRNHEVTKEGYQWANWVYGINQKREIK